MSDDVKKAICLAVFTLALASAYCFGAYMQYMGVRQQETTKRMVSFDQAKIACAAEHVSCPSWGK